MTIKKPRESAPLPDFHVEDLMSGEDRRKALAESVNKEVAEAPVNTIKVKVVQQCALSGHAFKAGETYDVGEGIAAGLFTHGWAVKV